MNPLTIPELLESVLSFLEPSNGVELAQLRRLQTVSKTWQNAIGRIVDDHLEKKAMSREVYLEDFLDWLFNPGTSRGELGVHPELQPGYLEELGEEPEYEEKFAPVYFMCREYPGYEYGGMGKMVYLDLLLGDKTIVNENTVEFSIYAIGVYRKMNRTLWNMRLRWNVEDYKISLINQEGYFVDVNLLISRLFYYEIEYNYQIVQPFIPPVSVESFTFHLEASISLRSVSGYVNSELKCIAQDTTSYTFEMKISVGGSVKSTAKFHWLPDRGLVIILDDPGGYYQSRNVILNIKRFFCLKIEVQDPFQKSAAQSYGQL